MDESFKRQNNPLYTVKTLYQQGIYSDQKMYSMECIFLFDNMNFSYICTE